MRAFHPRRSPGLTLVEMMISMGIIVIAMAASASILISSSNLLHSSNEVAESNDAARQGGERVTVALRSSGMGSAGGVWVNRSGTPFLVNPVFGMDGTTGTGFNPATPNASGTDELWVVAPAPTAMAQTCSSAGGTSVVLNSGASVVLSVTCTDSFQVGQPVLVTNLTQAALLTPITLVTETATTPGAIDYSERAISLSDSPTHGGFQKGDLVMGANVYHYYVGPTSTGTGLFQAVAQAGADASRPGVPFQDIPSKTLLIQDHVEDFQVAFGMDLSLLGNPDTYTFKNGLLPDFTAGLRSVRISVVTRGKSLQKNDRGMAITGQAAIQAGLVPLTTENHTANTALNQGYRRSVYRRRVELVNLALNQL